MLDFAKLHDTNKLRSEEVFAPVDSWSLTDWGCAMAGEAGEACNVIKKMKRVEDNIQAKKDPQSYEELRQMLAKELADIIIYVDLLATRARIDLERAVINKFNHVSQERGSQYFL